MRNIEDFIWNCYISSTPSVDIEKTTKIVKCSDHTLKLDTYRQLQDDFVKAMEGKLRADEVRGGTNCWCLCSGPSIVD